MGVLLNRGCKKPEAFLGFFPLIAPVAKRSYGKSQVLPGRLVGCFVQPEAAPSAKQRRPPLAAARMRELAAAAEAAYAVRGA
jgi:hypothetical protein